MAGFYAKRWASLPKNRKSLFQEQLQHGYAAGCEARAIPRRHCPDLIGLCPWSGLSPRTNGPEAARGIAQNKRQAAGGCIAIASRPAAKAEHDISFTEARPKAFK